MKKNNIDIVALVNGVPLISDGFRAQKMVALISNYRHSLFQYYDTVSAYLEPRKIEHLYVARNAEQKREYPEYGELAAEEQEKIDNAIKRILSIMPEWKIYFTLPVMFKKLTKNNQMVSLTNHNMPQTIFLGPKAYTSENWLEEVIIHEMAHVWLGLLCEIDEFHHHSSENRYTLPSGTGNKDARGVIFASHFAACVLKFLEKKRASDRFTPLDQERTICLETYFSGCLTQLIQMSELKAIGKEIVKIMSNEVCYD